MTKEEQLKQILNDTNLSGPDLAWLSSQLLGHGLVRQFQLQFTRSQDECPYTFAHTMAWCGHPGCRIE
jgi:hypothetical protein